MRPFTCFSYRLFWRTDKIYLFWVGKWMRCSRHMSMIHLLELSSVLVAATLDTFLQHIICSSLWQESQNELGAWQTRMSESSHHSSSRSNTAVFPFKAILSPSVCSLACNGYFTVQVPHMCHRLTIFVFLLLRGPWHRIKVEAASSLTSTVDCSREGE